MCFEEEAPPDEAQLELAALCGNLGNYLGTAGFFYDRYGAVASAKFGATLIGLGYGLQRLLCVYRERPRHRVPMRLLLRVGPRERLLGLRGDWERCPGVSEKTRGCCVGLLKSLWPETGRDNSGRGAVVIGVNFIVALAVFAGGLPLLALCKFERHRSAAGGRAVDAVAAGVLFVINARRGFRAAGACIAVLRVDTAAAAWVLTSALGAVIAVGLAWIVRAPTRRPALCLLGEAAVLTTPPRRWRLPPRARRAGGHKREEAAENQEDEESEDEDEPTPTTPEQTRGPARRGLAELRRSSSSPSPPPCTGMGLMTINNLGHDYIGARRPGVDAARATAVVRVANGGLRAPARSRIRLYNGAGPARCCSWRPPGIISPASDRGEAEDQEPSNRTLIIGGGGAVGGAIWR